MLRSKTYGHMILICAWLLASCQAGRAPGVDYSDAAYRWTADLSQPGQDLLARGDAKIQSIAPASRE